MRGDYIKKKKKWNQCGLSLKKFIFYSQAFHAVKFALKYYKIEL